MRKSVRTPENKATVDAWWQATKERGIKPPASAFVKLCAVVQAVRDEGYTDIEMGEALRRIAPKMPTRDVLANQCWGIRREREGRPAPRRRADEPDPRAPSTEEETPPTTRLW